MAQDSGERVFLYIYDLSRGLARSMSPSLIGRQIDGIWHTSVVCYGYEFYYGQGIFVTDRVGQTQYGTPMEIKDMGVTELPQEVFIEYIDSLRDIYTAEKYHLLENNCNTFTNDVCQFLVGKTIPGHISSLPEDFLNTPFGQSLRPMIDGAFSAPSRQLPQQSFPPTLRQTQSIPTPSPQTQNIVHHPTTTAEFDNLISSSSLAIAFFTSETCRPCKMIEPHYQSLSKTHTNITFLQIDTQRAFPIAKKHNITATPTFKTFLNGTLHIEWKGATPSTLDENIARLVDIARPSLPPTLRGTYGQSPILFPRVPPIEKILGKFDKIIPKPLLDCISSFLTAKDNNDVLVPPLVAWAKLIRELDYSVENAWMVVDLLRAAMADKRVSGWFAIDGLDILKGIIKTVTSRDEKEWQLRVVTVQLIVNAFSTPLLTVASLRGFMSELVELLSSSTLSGTLKLVKAAASALFNLSRLYLVESMSPGEDDVISIAVALVESLRTLLGKENVEDMELVRLTVVCLGGFVVLGKDSGSVKEVLDGVEAVDVVKKFKGVEGTEVAALIGS